MSNNSMVLEQCNSFERLPAFANNSIPHQSKSSLQFGHNESESDADTLIESSSRNKKRNEKRKERSSPGDKNEDFPELKRQTVNNDFSEKVISAPDNTIGLTNWSVVGKSGKSTCNATNVRLVGKGLTNSSGLRAAKNILSEKDVFCVSNI